MNVVIYTVFNKHTCIHGHTSAPLGVCFCLLALTTLTNLTLGVGPSTSTSPHPSTHRICKLQVIIYHLQMNESKGRFTRKLMRLKFQGPSLSPAPFKALGGALVMCSYCHMFLKNLQN